LSETIPPRSLAKSFFSNPLVGIIGSVASVISLFLAIYFYVEGKETPLLTYYVNPVKAVVVKAGQASRLTTSFDNKIIETDITATQIALWNQGKQAIKKDQILKPIVIYTENNTPILEATIRKTRREVSQLSLNADESQKGRITILWNILEHNDGAVIQLIYAGNPSINIFADGIIQGQTQIERQSEGAFTSADRRAFRVIGYVLLGFGIVLLIVIAYMELKHKSLQSFNLRDDWIVIVFPLFLFGSSIVLLIFSRDLGPPFGF
jgi:hypothetical protein